MRLLLIEDSPRLQQSLGKGLRHAGFALDLTGDGIQGLHFAKTHDYDVIILDLMVPGMDGLTLLKNLRANGSQTHVLILTARDSVDDRVLGLRTGADDYLTKPFAFDELLARVQALARRRHQNKNPIIEIGPLKIDTAARTVSKGDQPIELAAREYAILEFLALRRGQVISRTTIEAHIYDANVEPMSNVVDAAIYSLRRKIDAPGETSLIETRRGMGYMIRER